MELQHASTTESGEGEPDRAQTPTDVVFTTLGNRRRRYALHYLRQVDGQVPIRDLSEQLAAWETGKERAAVRPKERKRLYTALHQTHLPQMDRFGVIEYDKNRGTAALTDASVDFDRYLDQPHREASRIPWNALSIALGGVWLAVLGAATAGLAPLSSVDGYLYATAAVGLFTAMGLCQSIAGRRRQHATPAQSPDTLVPPAELAEQSRE